MHLIRTLFDIYILVIIADVILSYFPQYQNNDISKFIKKAAGVTLNPVRKILPGDLPFDISPIIVIVLINLLEKLW